MKEQIRAFLMAFVAVVTDTWPEIYFATYTGGLRAYSLHTGNVSVVSSENGDLLGVVYDPRGKLVYFSYWNGIFRQGVNVTDGKNILETKQCKSNFVPAISVEIFMLEMAFLMKLFC